MGTNESIEALPIGRRLAFDSAQGRLWVVCRSCERWNLTPFDERWEAIEQSERAFRGTRVRASTDNIGMARMRDGTELVRIGAPLRPEFSAWRYGDQFGRRRTRMLIVGTAAVAGGGLAIAGAAALGASVLGAGLTAVAPFANLLSVLGMASALGKADGAIAHPDGGKFEPYGTPRLIEHASPYGWGIDVGYAMRWTAEAAARADGSWWERAMKQEGKNELGRLQLSGQDALPLLRRTLPRINRGGARRTVIQDGVDMIDVAGGPDRFALWAVRKRREWAARSTFGDTGDLTAIPAPARLAFEMALNEDSERRAMEGELAELRLAWQSAEGIAAIADELLTPDAVTRRIASLKDHDRQASHDA